MDWSEHAATWPNAAHSRFTDSRPHRWHLQETGTGPTLLLLHGAGASTHTWRHILPDLARDFHVVALDLPGQGFTKAGGRQRLGLDAMAQDIAALCAAQNLRPAAIIGHSAGAAIALRLTQTLQPPPQAIIAINGALGNFRGVAGWIFPMMAKLLALNPLTAAFFARTASSEQSVRNLIDGTGSRIDDEGIALYRALVADRRHVDATLGMMAQWNLDPLLHDLPNITVPTLFLTGANDTAVPPDTSDTAAARMPDARVIHIAAKGHMLHEEDPARVLAEIRLCLSQNGIGLARAAE